LSESNGGGAGAQTPTEKPLFTEFHIDVPKALHEGVQEEVEGRCTESPAARQVFLARNRRKSKRAGKEDRFVCVSGLDVRICTGTNKIFYVEGTEDFLYWPGSLRTARNTKPSRCMPQAIFSPSSEVTKMETAP
jgi:hypothetical protein